MNFSVDMLLEENYLAPTVLTTEALDRTFTSMGYEFMTEMSNQFTECNRKFYGSLLEAGNDKILITESFSSFSDGVKAIIDKFLDFIKRIYKKFEVYIHKLIKSDKYIKNHKKDLDKFSDDQEFTMSIFNFTNLDDSEFPKIGAYDTYTTLFKDIALLPDGTKDSDITGDFLMSRLKAASDHITENSRDWSDTFRGIVLGETTPYDPEDYRQELFRKFRGGDDTPSSETITYSIVQDSLTTFLNYDKLIKSINKSKNTVDKEYNEIRRSLKQLEKFGNDKSIMNDIFSNEYTGADKNKYTAAYNDKKTEIDTELDIINRSRMTKIQEMCNIHIMAFTAKLDAAKARFKQDKNILYMALKKVAAIKESFDVDPVMINFFDESLSDSYDFALYLVNESCNQDKTVNYITESICLESGNYSDLSYVNESFMDGLKNIISKVIEAIKTMFNKFKTNMSAMFTTDETFLSKYKNVILNNHFKERDVTIFDYRSDLLNTFKVPAFINTKFEQMIQIDMDNADYGENENNADFEEKFISLHRQELPNIKPDGGDIKEKVINAIKGGEDPIETTGTALDSKRVDMYNFCAKSAATINDLEKDLTTVDNNRTTIAQELSRKTKEFEDAEKAAAENNQNGSSPETPSNTDGTNESFYSSLYGSYITEEGMKAGKVKDDKSGTSISNGSTTGSMNTVKTVAVKSDEAKGAANTASSNAANNSNKEGSDKKASELMKKYETSSRFYFLCCSKIISGKISAMQAMHKDYMSLLRIHVKDYAGDAAANTASGSASGSGAPTVNIEVEDGKGKKTIKSLTYLKTYQPKDKGAVGKLKDLFSRAKGNNLSAAILDQSAKLKGSSLSDGDVFKYGDKYLVYDDSDSFKEVSQGDVVSATQADNNK